MNNFWKGFLSIFDFGASPKINIKYRPKPFKWYHKGPWWEHPLHGDTWKDTDEKSRD